MSNITLSAAVRSNLLSLQNTASLLDTTQTRLATGNKVNSALDNPTSYFTASSLNARASDLGNLLDSVSNAVQTIQAANDGITSITKLVESAQATANQAQQLSETVSTGSAASAGALTGGAFTTLNVSGAGASPTAGKVTAGAFSAVDVSGAGSPATAGTATGTSAFVGPMDLSSGVVSFDVSVDGALAQSVSLNATAVSDYNTAHGSTLVATSLSATDVSLLVNEQLTGATVDGSSGTLVFTSASTGTGSHVAISNVTDTAADGLAGLGTDSGNSTAGHDLVTAASLSFSVNVNAAGPQTVTLSAASITTYNSTHTAVDAANLSAADIADVINAQLSSTVATAPGGVLTFTSGTTGLGSSVAVSTVTAAGGAINTTGISANSDTGSAAGTADSVSFDLSIDSASTTITLDAAHITTYNTAHSSATVNAASLSAADVANVINYQAGVNVAAASGSGIKLTSTTTGLSSNVTVSGYTAAVTGGATGIANGNNSGSANSSVSGPNPARAALISQFNGLLDQIDQLTKDAGYNGNNLLSGTSSQLKVVFNETGTSSLTISGKDTSAMGLGLDQLSGSGFDTNAAITTIIGKLKTATDTLRADASGFGSNLSVVQTRQDFTKALINTLQTGASNLTLADSNEEAANLLALQTRQSLSTKALSLASQSDQNVLRLLQ